MSETRIRNASILDFLNLSKVVVDDRGKFDNPIFCSGEKPHYSTWFGLKPYLKFFYYYFHPKKQVIFALNNNEIAAVAVLSANIVEGFFVNKKFREKGIGTKLMGHVIKFLGEKNYESVKIGVQTSNYIAKEFYKKSGFVEKEVILERQIEAK